MKSESRNDGKPEKSIPSILRMQEGGIKSVTDEITDNLEAIYPSPDTSYAGV